MATGKFISYLRVSTKQQGASGLGLEAQQRAVADFLNGGRWKLLDEFIEVESGKNNERIELQKALRACRLHGATLLVAKLDRLARNAYFLLGLQESGVDFVACDMPAANRLTVGILAMVAEEEARMISARTKAALRAAKARGVKLGTPRNLTHKARRKGTGKSYRVRAAKAARRAQDIAPTLAEIQSEGASTLAQIAAALNRRKIPAPRGGKWRPVQVSRVISRLNSAA
ncbi:MAG: recombinase family protein [Gemmatimonadaceae bacterium]